MSRFIGIKYFVSNSPSELGKMDPVETTVPLTSEIVYFKPT